MVPLTFDISKYLLLLVYAVLAYKGIKIIYRLYFSPLAKFPGPRLAAATSLYEFYFDVVRGGQFMFELDRLHDKYGPILRINPHEIHIKDPSFYDTVYGGPINKRDRVPSFIHSGLPRATFEAGPHGLHRERRKLLSPYLSTQSVTGLQPVIQEKVDLVCSHLSRRVGTGEFLDLHSISAAFVVDVTSTFVLGRASCYGYLNNAEITDEWKKNVTSVFEGLVLLRHLPFVFNPARRFPRIATLLYPTFFWVERCETVCVVTIWHCKYTDRGLENTTKREICVRKTRREIDDINYSLQRETTRRRKRPRTPEAGTDIFDDCWD